MSERRFGFFGRKKESVGEQPPSTLEQEEVEKKAQLTRRDVLKGMGAAAAVAAVGIRESGSGGHHASEGPHVEKPEVTEAEDNRFRLLDMTTATAVVAGSAGTCSAAAGSGTAADPTTTDLTTTPTRGS